MPAYWFPKTKGRWGWGAANCWHGRVVQLLYPALAAGGAGFFLHRQDLRGFLSFVLSVTVVFVAIHWIKGERSASRRVD